MQRKALVSAFLASGLALGLMAADASAAAPVANPDAVTTLTGKSVDIPVLANDSDPDGDVLTLAGFPTRPVNGTVSRSGNIARYKPNAGFSGTDQFNYRVTDATGIGRNATVTVTVKAASNKPPLASPDRSTTAANTSVAIPVLANDRDPDGDTLRIVGMSVPGHGSLARAAGVITYTPAQGFAGDDAFTYKVGDGKGGTDRARVSVTVAAASAVQSDSASLSWSIPTTRADGSPIPISEITGYEIYVIAESTGKTAVIPVSGGMTSSYTLTGLPPDTYHFSMAALDAQGNLSELSPIVSKTISR